MKILRTKDDLKEAIYKVRNLGFVPTMGSFHDGHISLINFLVFKTASPVPLGLF